MNSECGIGRIPPFWPIGFLFPSGAFLRSRIYAALRAKGKKRKARGRKKRNAPRNELRYLTDLKEKPSHRGEEDTEQEN